MRETLAFPAQFVFRTEDVEATVGYGDKSQAHQIHKKSARSSKAVEQHTHGITAASRDYYLTEIGNNPRALLAHVCCVYMALVAHIGQIRYSSDRSSTDQSHLMI